MNKQSLFINEKKLRFIPFITAGDPSPELTIDLALMLQEIGADAIELGIPYSDPLADGPVIQRASQRALKHRMTLEKAMELVPLMKERGLKIPVIIFTYYNLLLQLGENKWMSLAKKYGIDGLLVPDLPFEESVELRSNCLDNDIVFISLVAPTTSDERLKLIGEEAQGFLYCVSSLGVTGVRNKFDSEVYRFLERVRNLTTIPIAVGFGISSRDQVEELQDYCDGYIVGSAIIREIEARYKQLLSVRTKQHALKEIQQALITNLIKPCEVS